MPKSDFVFGTFDTSMSAAYYKLQPINFPTPEKDVETFEVPGRSGALLIDHGSYKNVELSVEIAIDGMEVNSDFLTLYDALRAAIMVQSGYQRLEDSLYPDEYRVARAVMCEREQSDTRTGKAVFTFDAKPQRYLTSGETAARVLSPSSTAIDVTGTGAEIYNAAFLTEAVRWDWTRPYSYPEFQNTQTTILDVAAISGASAVRLYYPDNRTNMVFANNNSGSPLAGGSFGTATFGRYTYFTPGFPITLPRTRNGIIANYMCFTTPYFWEVLDANENVLTSAMPDEIECPVIDGIMDYSPLITIKVSGAVSGLVATLGDNLITLNTPATIDGKTITDILIDCETLNAYTVIDGMTYSLNQYVTLDGTFLLPGNAPTIMRANHRIDMIMFVPRWWKI